MRRRTGFIILTLLVVIGIRSRARADVRQGEFLFGPYALYAIPTDDYPSPPIDDVPYNDMGNDIESGPGLSGAVDYVLRPNLSAGIEFKAYFLEADESILQDFLDYHVPGLDVVEVTWRTMHFGARSRYYLQSGKNVNPFVQGGLGLYVNKLKAEFQQARGSGSSNAFTRSESSSDIGVSIGPGFLIRTSNNVRLSLDVTFTNIFSDERNVRYVAASVGLLFGLIPDW